MIKFILSLLTLTVFCCAVTNGQLIINEGSNKNATILHDEDGEYNDWIELYNAGTESIDLGGYSLTDNSAQPVQWVFPSYLLQPGQFMVVFCSSKDRYASPAAITFNTSYGFTPQFGWNNHAMQAPFLWDEIGRAHV